MPAGNLDSLQRQRSCWNLARWLCTKEGMIMYSTQWRRKISEHTHEKDNLHNEFFLQETWNIDSEWLLTEKEISQSHTSIRNEAGRWLDKSTSHRKTFWKRKEWVLSGMTMSVFFLSDVDAENWNDMNSLFHAGTKCSLIDWHAEATNL